MTNTNHGVMITGGTVAAGAIAAGPHAVASNRADVAPTQSLDELRRLVEQLLQEVRDHASGLDDGEQALTVTQLTQKEVTKDSPDRGRVLAFLKVLASAVGSVASLATSVSAVEQAVSKVL
jgi:Family of unknown function (DUF5955)